MKTQENKGASPKTTKATNRQNRLVVSKSLSPGHPLLIQRALEDPYSARPETILQLQRMYGNQFVSRLFAGTGEQKVVEESVQRAPEETTSQPPVVHVTPTTAGDAQRTLLQRTWEDNGTDWRDRKNDIWKGKGFKNKIWYRWFDPEAKEFYYKFENDSGSSMDSELESEWKSVGKWNEIGWIPPGTGEKEEEDLSSTVDTTSDLPDSDGKGWDVRTFIGVLIKQELSGLCNALSAAWLTNLIAPDPKGQMGVHEHNFEKVKLLKNLLDWMVSESSYLGTDSTDITFAFVTYFKQRGFDSTWFETLSEKTLNDRAEDFKLFVRKKWKVKGSDYERGNIAGKYEELSNDGLYTTFDNILEPFFDMREAFHGTVAVKAWALGEDGPQDHKGHEMAVRYNPEGYVFEIYDQNGGLRRKSITEQEDIAEMLADYLYIGYVENPMSDTTHAKFELQIYPLKE